MCLVHWLAAMEGTVERAQRRARQLLVQLTHARARIEAWKHSTFAARSLAAPGEQTKLTIAFGYVAKRRGAKLRCVAALLEQVKLLELQWIQGLDA